MTLSQLRILVAIADAGLNITLAAERLHATQPGLSKQLKQLEEYLGLKLIQRKGKSLEKLTIAGEQILLRARAILDQARDIRTLAANMRNERTGSLRIATTHTQARYVLPRALSKLRAKFSEVSVHLDPAGTEQALHALGAGAADIAIVSTAGNAPEGYAAIPAFNWDRVVLVRKSHALARSKVPITLQQLAEYPLVSYESTMKADSSLRRAFDQADLYPHLACTAADADLIKTYVREGMGVGILASMAIEQSDLEDLEIIAADHLLPRCTTWVVMRADGVMPKYVEALMEFLAPHVHVSDLRRLAQGQGQTEATGSAKAPDWESTKGKVANAS